MNAIAEADASYNAGAALESAEPLPDNLANGPAAQPEPAPNAPRGYVRLAVMDGKTLGHRVSYDINASA